MKVFTINDTIHIYTYKNHILYKLTPQVEFESNQRIERSEPYFIYRQGFDSGYFFNSKNDSTGLTMQTDSFLVRKASKGRDFDIPSDSLWRLVAVSDNKNEIEEKYAPIRQTSELDFDSIYYYYSKDLKDANYSFSKKLDSLKNRKLYKIRLLYNEKFSDRESSLLPKREFHFEMREVSTLDRKEVKGLFEIFLQRMDKASR